MILGTLGGYTLYDPPDGAMDEVNYFDMGTGASRHGIGQFLMARVDYNKLVTGINSANGLTTLSIGDPTAKAGKDGKYTLYVQLKVYVAGMETYSKQIKDSNNTDVVVVTVLDQRVKQGNPMSWGINVQKEGFTYTSGSDAYGGTTPDFYASTLSGGTTEYTWANVFSTVFELNTTQRAVSDEPTSWKPRNLIFDEVGYNLALDAVCQRLYYVVGFDWRQTGTLGRDGYKICIPGDIDSYNGTMRASARMTHLIGGGDGSRNLKRMPGKFRATFKVMDVDSTDPYATRKYTKDTTFSTADTTQIEPLHIGEYPAVRKSGTIIGQALLDTIAASMSNRAQRSFYAPNQDEIFAGIWPFYPDGTIRFIRWINDGTGAKTVIRYNNAKNYREISDNYMDAVQNQLVVGLGSMSVGAGQSGTRYVWGLGGCLITPVVTNVRWDSGIGQLLQEKTACDLTKTESEILTGESCSSNASNFFQSLAL